MSGIDPCVIRQLFPGAPPARPASPTLIGTAPVRAVQHCEPFVLANSLGWHAYLPFDFIFEWDGTQVSWLSPDAGGWVPLGNVRYPIPLEPTASENNQPATLPPMLSGLSEPGLVQIWTGLVARTPDDWLMAVRPPTNFPRSPKYESFEGIIDTSWWFGPLIQTIRLKHTGRPIIISAKTPFTSLVPVRRQSLSPELRNQFSLEAGAATMSSNDWRDFEEALLVHSGRKGGYRRASAKHAAIRKDQQCQKE